MKYITKGLWGVCGGEEGTLYAGVDRPPLPQVNSDYVLLKGFQKLK